MLKNTRSCCLDIYDYSGNKVCNIYDSTSDISGQATNVYVRRERNGWKELSFRLPSKCFTGEREESNYRLEYLIADYKIKRTTDKGEDWFIITEHRIAHINKGKEVSVTAGHISSLLKNKALSLMFSDDEGNNVGTCEELLTTILEGTGFKVGKVANFIEDDGFTVKVRSLTADVRTGALRLITDLCDKFEARPVYNGDYTVDIVPVNPFSTWIQDPNNPDKYIHIKQPDEEDELPDVVLNEDIQVIELHYDKNVRDVTRTLNTDNLCTRLYAYGSYGDMNGICGINTAKHIELIYRSSENIPAEAEVSFVDDDGITQYFTACQPVSAGSELNFSMLDFVSRSYIWDGTKAHELYSDPKQPFGTQIVLERIEKKSVQNYFDYLMDFDYYRKIGLFTAEHLQKTAEFQRTMPEVIKTAIDATTKLIEKEEELSLVAEANTGFLRLDIKQYEDVNGALKLIINKDRYPDGVMYRSDYDSNKRNYFNWYVAIRLKENGDPVDYIGSIVYIVHTASVPITYEKAYLKEIDGKAESYYYNDQDNPDPSTLTLWMNSNKVSASPEAGDQFFLFCSNSMSGQLGAREASIESLENTLQETTKIATEEHPTYFRWDNDDEPSVDLLRGSYGWYYRSSSTGQEPGTLYYCPAGGNGWSKVAVVLEEEPSVDEYSYYYNIKEGIFYIKYQGAWNWEDTAERRRLNTNFTKVISACKKRDMLFKGVHKRYSYMPEHTLAKGNYIFLNEFGYYWAFTTDMDISWELWMDAESNLVYQYGDTNFLTNEQGSVDKATGEEIYSDDLRRTGYFPVYAGFEYKYLLPNNSFVVFYDANYVVVSAADFVSEREADTFVEGFYTTPENIKFARIVASKFDSSVSFRVNGYENYMIIKPELKAFDAIKYPVKNELRGTSFYPGGIDDNNGTEITHEQQYRSNYIQVYDKTDYSYSLPNGSFIVFYLQSKRFVRTFYFTDDESVQTLSGTFTVPDHAEYMRIVTPVPMSDIGSYDVHVANQNSVFFLDKQYTVLIPTPQGENLGVHNFLAQMVERANDAYLNYLPAYKKATQLMKDKDNELTTLLGDMYREGYWQKSEYIEGDEEKLYIDTKDALYKIAKPEASYEFTFLDLYNANRDMGFSIDNTDEVEWPDLDESFAVHLVDTDIDVECWAAADVVNTCDDQPWNSGLEATTELTTVRQHSFTDALAYIADVANTSKIKQSLYERAANLSGSGQIAADKLDGAISAAQNVILGGSSNWHTDPKTGGIVFVSSDNNSAMLLTGDGWMVANTKNQDGDFNWRTAATGAGIVADVITAGELSAERLLAGSITTDKIAASVGQELEIGSNQALMMYATTSGDRPAGSLKTQSVNENGTYSPVSPGDSFIEIAARRVVDGSPEEAHINIMTGGSINVYAGSSMNIEAKGKMHIKSGSDLAISSPKFNIYKDENNTTRVDIQGKVTASTGNIAGFEIGYRYKDGITDADLEDDENIKYRYMYAGETTTVDSEGNGVYIGTNGMNFGGKLVYKIQDSVGGTKISSLNVNAETVELGKQSSGSGTFMKLNALSGTIDMEAQSTINVKAGSEININAGNTLSLITDGIIELGKSGNPFTIGADNSNAYIYNLKTLPGADAPDSTNVFVPDSEGKYNTGVYVGTNGLYIGQRGYQYIKVDVNATGTNPVVEIKGDIKASGGDIGGWDIQQNALVSPDKQISLLSGGDYRILAGGTTSADANFWLDKDGKVKAVSGNIGGWYIGTDYIGNQDSNANSTVGMQYIIPTDNLDPVVFWAGEKKTSNPNFQVTYKGALTSNLGTIAGWKITPTALQDKDGIITISNVAGTEQNVIAIKDSTSVTFSVTGKGFMTSTSGQIGGWYIGENSLFNKTTLGSATVGMYSTQADNEVAFWAGGAYNFAPFRVQHNGKIHASLGDIGGWTLTGTDTVKRLSSGDGDTYVALDSGSPGNDYAIWAGAATGDVAPFSATRTGHLHATDADIQGIITTDTITATGGTIAGFKIADNMIISNDGTTFGKFGMYNMADTSILAGVMWAGGNGNSKNGSFTVFNDGSVSVNKITANSGSIGELKFDGDSLKSENGNFEITSSGSVSFRDGSIGGFDVGPGYISAFEGNFGFFNVNPFASTGATVFRAGAFEVKDNGVVTANEFYINAGPTTTSISGTITCGSTITGASLSAGSGTISGGSLSVSGNIQGGDISGVNVTASNTVNAQRGGFNNIWGWCIDNRRTDSASETDIACPTRWGLKSNGNLYIENIFQWQSYTEGSGDSAVTKWHWVKITS